MKIAVEGCAHGDLENIYDTIQILEEKHNISVDLLICCGDFQSSRNKDDLMCMAVPAKYQNICTFYKYYSGEKLAPILTIFIGGNHEASNYLQELPYGGWVAPNIYYLGYAGVINVGGLRIGGLSGIYKGNDYLKGHFECVPYTEQSKRSVYHVRNLEVFRLKQVSEKIDIFLSHDWPADVTKWGNVKQLLRKKTHFREDIENGELGSKPNTELLHQLKPNYWFSAHLHCKFPAVIPHSEKKCTKFLALDKCLPKRKFLQILDVETAEKNDEKIAENGEKIRGKVEISYDLEWLAILANTNHLLSVKSCSNYMPGPGGNQRYNFTPTTEEKSNIFDLFNRNLTIPKIYSRIAPVHDPNNPNRSGTSLKPILNPQTITFCEILGIDDPVTKILQMEGIDLDLSIDLNSTITFIDDSIDSESIPQEIDIDGGDFLCQGEIASEGEKEKNEEEKGTEIQGEITEQSSSSPIPKKFKRRNLDLYM